MSSQNLAPRNSLMGMSDEVLLKIIRETLGWSPVVPLRALIDQRAWANSPLAPFAGHAHLLDLAVGETVDSPGTIWTLDFADLEGSFTCDQLCIHGRRVFPHISIPALLSRISYLRIIERKPFASSHLTSEHNTHDFHIAAMDMIYPKVRSLSKLRVWFPTLRGLEVKVLADLSGMRYHHKWSASTWQQKLAAYYRDVWDTL